MQVLILDGHPDAGRLVSSLLDDYAAALPQGCAVERIAVRDLAFEPVLRGGYAREQPLEPDLVRAQAMIAACDHLVVGFPLWWGGEPALLKGFIDRVFLPGFAFRYHKQDPFWDRLLVGRSADTIITLDTPPLYLRFAYGNAIVRRWRGQVLGFCGFKPLRILLFGPVKQGGVEKGIAQWRARVRRAATTIPAAKGRKLDLRGSAD